MLPLGVLGHVVQLHRETADRAREALRHVLDPANRPVLKASGDQSRLVDASAAVLSRELMRARFELPIQDVIKVVHGGRPCGAPPHWDRDPDASHLSIASGPSFGKGKAPPGVETFGRGLLLLSDTGRKRERTFRRDNSA